MLLYEAWEAARQDGLLRRSDRDIAKHCENSSKTRKVCKMMDIVGEIKFILSPQLQHKKDEGEDDDV